MGARDVCPDCMKRLRRIRVQKVRTHFFVSSCNCFWETSILRIFVWLVLRDVCIEDGFLPTCLQDRIGRTNEVKNWVVLCMESGSNKRSSYSKHHTALRTMVQDTAHNSNWLFRLEQPFLWVNINLQSLGKMLPSSAALQIKVRRFVTFCAMRRSQVYQLTSDGTFTFTSLERWELLQVSSNSQRLHPSVITYLIYAVLLVRCSCTS